QFLKFGLTTEGAEAWWTLWGSYNGEDIQLDFNEMDINQLREMAAAADLMIERMEMEEGRRTASMSNKAKEMKSNRFTIADDDEEAFAVRAEWECMLSRLNQLLLSYRQRYHGV